MADYARQRMNMVDAQVRTNDVTDPRIHAAMRELPRELFVPSAKRAMAYADATVEVAHRRYLLDPRTLAKLVELVAVRPRDRILDVACATGYSSALLARLGGTVTALEQDADLVRVATGALASVGAKNATVVQGVLVEGAKERSPFDVIFLNGAVESPPDGLLAQLSEGGRLGAVLKNGPLGRATLFLKKNGRIGTRPGFEANVPLLAAFTKTVGFVF